MQAIWHYLHRFRILGRVSSRPLAPDTGMGDDARARTVTCLAALRSVAVCGLVGLAWIQIAQTITAASPSILCVYAEGGPTGAPCTNATAYLTVQHALDDAVTGDQIRIANWRTDTIAGYEPIVVGTAVSITGGYRGGAGGFVEPTRPTQTIIDGIRPPARPAITITGPVTVNLTHIVARGGVSNPSGTLVVPHDALLLQSDGNVSGHFMLDAGATLDFISPGSTVLASGSRIEGAGIARVRQLGGGSLTIDGDLALQTFLIDAGNVILNGNLTVRDLKQASATVGGRGNISVQRAFVWTGDGSEISGSGTTTIQSDASLTIDGDGLKTMNGRTLVNRGTIRWKRGSIRAGTGTTVVNEQAGQIDIETSADGIFDYYDATNRPATPLINRGTIRKASAATTTFGLPLDNHGTVMLERGSIRLANGGTASGTFVVPSATTLEFGGGHYTLNTSSRLNVAGTLRFTSGTVASGGTITSAGDIVVGGSAVTVSGTYNIAGRTTITAGKIAFDAPTGASSRETILQGGTLAGTGTFTCVSTCRWTSGAMEGPGRTVVPRDTTLALTGPEQIVLDGRIIDNSGTIIWSGGPMLSRNQALIDNRVGATFLARPPDGTVYNDGGSGSVFNNAGRLEKTTGGVTTIGMTVRNTGVISVTTGVLNLGGDVRNDGSISVERGSRLNVSKQFAQHNGITTLNDATLAAGSGIDLIGGSLIGTGELDANVRNGAAIIIGVLPGILNVSGEFVQTPAGALAMQIAHPSMSPSFDQLRVLGKIAVDGTLAVDWADDVIPAHGDAFPIITAPVVQGTFARVTGIPVYPATPIGVFYFRDRINIVAPRRMALPLIITVGGRTE